MGGEIARSGEGAGEDEGAAALGGGEIAVAGAEGEAVRLADDGADHELDREVEVADDVAEDGGLSRAGRLADPRPSQEAHAAGLELKVLIQQALAQLSPELREAVVFRDLEDMDYKEIAQVLRIPEGTVKSRISRGRGELARLLQRIEGQVV